MQVSHESPVRDTDKERKELKRKVCLTFISLHLNAHPGSHLNREHLQMNLSLQRDATSLELQRIIKNKILGRGYCWFT